MRGINLGDQAWFLLQEASVRRVLYTTPRLSTPTALHYNPNMAHLIDGEPANFEAHFLYSDNPRDGFCVMSVKPLVHYEFQTPAGFLNTHTIVRCEILPPPFLLYFPPPYPPLFH